MKEFTQSGKTRRLVLLIICGALICLLYSPSPSRAGEAVPDASESLRVEKVKLEGVQLTKMYEDRILIDGKEYIVTERTKIYKKDNEGRDITIKISEIAPPCLVDIIYTTYSACTESTLFYPGDRVLSSVLVKKEGLEGLPFTPHHELGGSKEEVKP